MKPSKLALTAIFCAVLLLGKFALTQTTVDFDGKSADQPGLLSDGTLKVQKFPSSSEPQDIRANPDFDWRNDSSAFQSVKIDKKVYSGLKEETKKSVVVIDESEFKEKLEEFAGVRDVVIGGETTRITERGSRRGRKLARAWLEEEYRKIGFQTSVEGFDLGFGANFVAAKEGSSGKVVILSAHMDSVSNAGADDDGSGIIASLLIAKALKNIDNKHTLQVLAFDLEEMGLLGSSAYARTLDKERVIGDIHMDMIAFNSRKDGRFHLIDCDRQDSKFLTASIMTAVQSMGLHLTRVAACTDRSDHASFWKKGMPAVVISENFFGGDHDVCYHEKCDVVDQRLDFKYASEIATALANSLAPLLESDLPPSS